MYSQLKCLNALDDSVDKDTGVGWGSHVSVELLLRDSTETQLSDALRLTGSIQGEISERARDLRLKFDYKVYTRRIHAVRVSLTI